MNQLWLYGIGAVLLLASLLMGCACHCPGQGGPVPGTTSPTPRLGPSAPSGTPGPGSGGSRSPAVPRQSPTPRPQGSGLR